MAESRSGAASGCASWRPVAMSSCRGSASSSRPGPRSARRPGNAWERDADAGAAFRAVLRVHLAAVSGGQLLHDRKPETGAGPRAGPLGAAVAAVAADADRGGPRGIAAPEPLERPPGR